MESNLNLYYVFYTVARAGSITNAARELYISQPAISKSIQKLEETAGLQLFDRKGKGVQLTYEGTLLYQQVSEAMEALKRGEEQLRQVRDLGAGHLKVGVSSTLCKFMLLPHLKEFRRQNPHIRISIVCQPTNETLLGLIDGTIDIGLIAEPDRQHDLLFYPIQEIEDIFVASAGYLEMTGLPHSGQLSPEQLLHQNITFLLLDQQNASRAYIDRFFPTASLSREQLMEVSSMELLIEFTRTDLGIACVIREFVQQELTRGELIRLELTDPIPKRTIGMAIHEKNRQTSSVAAFLDFYKR